MTCYTREYGEQLVNENKAKVYYRTPVNTKGEVFVTIMLLNGSTAYYVEKEL